MTSAFVWRTCCSWLLSDALSAYRLPTSRLLFNLGGVAFVSAPRLLSFDPAHCETSYVRHYLTDFATATFRSRAALLCAAYRSVAVAILGFQLLYGRVTRLYPLSAGYASTEFPVLLDGLGQVLLRCTIFGIPFLSASGRASRRSV
jgi:hypothetical protein